jgi:5'-3' exonuclease
MSVTSLFALDQSKPTDHGPEKPYDTLMIDGGGMVVSAWAANRSMERAEDRVRSGVYVFMTTLASLAAMVKNGGKVVCVWDGKDNRAYRRGMHPWYKHGRGSVIDRVEVRIIMAELGPILEAMGIAQVTKDYHEADDLVATLSLRAEEAGERVIMFSDDKDYLQLVSDTVHLSRRSLDGIVMSPSQCELHNIEYGERCVFMKALAGDSGDNIKGLQGIGEKKAFELMQILPDLLPQIRDDPSTADWSGLEDGTLRKAFLRSARKLVFPVPIATKHKKFYAATAKARGLDSDIFCRSEVSEEHALYHAALEVAKCLKLVTMNRHIDTPELVMPEPKHAVIPALLRKLELENESDMYVNLFKLAGVLHPDASPGWRAAVRVGASIDEYGAPLTGQF